MPLRALVRSVSGGADVDSTWQLVTKVRTPMTAVWVDDDPRSTARAAAAAGAVDAMGSGAAAGLAGLSVAAAALAPSERPRFVRDEGVINWMVRHPWIGEGS